MDKEAIRKQFIAQIKGDLDVLVQSALAAKEAATHSESKAEDQYDTRGLEASYLAGAQSERVTELEGLLAVYRNLDLEAFNDETPLRSTALIELSSENKTLYCLLMPQGGGRSLEFEGKRVQVVTPQSPLGQALLGRKPGDEIEVRTQIVREFTIVKAW